MRNTAISFSVCVSYDPDRLNRMIDEIKNEFRVIIDLNLELITVRHYIDSMLPKLVEEKLLFLKKGFVKQFKW